MSYLVNITPIVNALIMLIGAIITVYLVPYIKKNTTEKQRKEILDIVKIGVAAAEQLYKESGAGEQKKKYVLDFLASKGYSVDDQLVLNAIEAAVNQINGSALYAI